MSNSGKPAPDSELRYWRTDLETRSEGSLRRIGGLGVPYDQRSRLLPGGFMEVVERRALAKTLADNLNVVCRMEHHPEWLLGSIDSNTLRLTNEERGLSYVCDLPDTGAGNDCYELVRTGRMSYSSMGFQCFQDEFRRDGSVLVRHLVSIRLTEVSPVAQPGYAQTSTAIRNLAGQLGEDPADVEAIAAQGELRSLFVRTDQQVTATPTILPATAEARNIDAGQPATPIDHLIKENRERAMEFNRDGRLDLADRIEKSRQVWETLELERQVAANIRNLLPVSETRSVWWSGERVPVTAPPRISD